MHLRAICLVTADKSAARLHLTGGCKSAFNAFMLDDYLAQMERAAKEAAIDLAEACRVEGVAATTLVRWRKGEVSPREGTAKAVLDRIAAMARKLKKGAF